MKKFDQILWCENTRRLKVLRLFKNRLKDFMKNVKYSDIGTRYGDYDLEPTLLLLDEAKRIVRAAGISATLSTRVGNTLLSNISYWDNLPNDSLVGSTPFEDTILTDTIRAIGVYESERPKILWRILGKLFSPKWWVELVSSGVGTIIKTAIDAFKKALLP